MHGLNTMINFKGTHFVHELEIPHASICVVITDSYEKNGLHYNVSKGSH